MSVEERIKIARKAIKEIRKEERNWPNPKEKFPLTYGFWGVLDYIEYGNYDKILESNLQNMVQKIIASLKTAESK